MTTLATEPSVSTSEQTQRASLPGSLPVEREIPLAPEATPRTSTTVSDRLGYSVNVDLAKLAVHPQPAPSPRLMPRVGPLNDEPFWKRALYVLVMAAILCGYSYMLKCFFAPAHAGINQNGYLVGGKNLAEYGTMGVKLNNSYEYLGWMWNLVDRDPSPTKQDIWFYPKYPIGTGALFAASLHVSKWLNHGDWDQGKIWSFYVNPVSVVLCVAAVFMLTRQVAGSFAGICGAMMMACCQVMLAYAEQPLSHGPALACVTWGMYFLYRYWQTASSWRGILAGLCLGYAVTIRYTEGLLIIPIAAVLISMVRYDVRATRWWSMSVMLTAPIVAILLAQGMTWDEQWHNLALTGWQLIIPIAVLALALGAVVELKHGFADRRDYLAALGRLLVIAGVTTILIVTLRKVFKISVDEIVARHDKRWAISMLVAVLIGLGLQWRLKRDAWVRRTSEWVRIVLAAGLVWTAVYYTEPSATGPAAVDRMVKLAGIKTVVIGAIALLYFVPWSEPRRYLKLAIPALAWLVPTGTLLAYNYLAMGSFSGYDTTHESTAFTWRTFTQKWDDTVQQIYDYSLYMIPPLAIAGMFLMYRWNWRAALLLTLWFIPGLALYIAYYFGQQRPGYWYLRFFLTLFPPMIVAAMWLMKSAAEGMVHQFNTVPAAIASVRDRVVRRRGSVAVPIAMGIVTYCSCAVGLSIAVPSLEREHASSINLWYTGDQIVNTIKMAQHKAPKVYINDKLAKPVVFAEGRGNPNAPLCNFLQFWGDYELYPSDGFSGGAGLTGFRDTSNNQPNPMQPERQEYFNNFFRGKNDTKTAQDQNKIMNEALDEGRLVFAALQPGAASFFRNKFVTPGGFEMRLIAQWREPAKVPMERSSSQLDPLARGMPMNPTRASQTFQLYQIARKPPAPKPAATPAGTSAATPTTAPAPAPATSPAKKFAATPPAPATSPATAPAKQLTATPAPSPASAPPTNVLSVFGKLRLPGFGAPPTTKPSR